MGIFNIFKKKDSKKTYENISVQEKMQHEIFNTNGQFLYKLTPDGELPFGWAAYNKEFCDDIRNKYSYFLDLYSDSKYKSPRNKYEGLKSFILFVEDAFNYCSSLSECHEKYFRECVFSMDLLQKAKEEYECIKDTWPELQREWEKKQQLLEQLDIQIMDALEMYPGILQSEFYKLFDSSVKNDVSNKLYNLACEGKLERTKSGRSYILNLK